VFWATDPVRDGPKKGVPTAGTGASRPEQKPVELCCDVTAVPVGAVRREKSPGHKGFSAGFQLRSSVGFRRVLPKVT